MEQFLVGDWEYFNIEVDLFISSLKIGFIHPILGCPFNFNIVCWMLVTFWLGLYVQTIKFSLNDILACS